MAYSDDDGATAKSPLPDDDTGSSITDKPSNLGDSTEVRHLFVALSTLFSFLGIICSSIVGGLHSVLLPELKSESLFLVNSISEIE